MKDLSRENSLNTIRLLAAIQVMYGHLVVHLNVSDLEWGGVSVQQCISRILNFFPGVPIFFFISGFLLLRSVSKTDNWKEYAYNRMIRLYPELWIVVLIEIFTIVVFYFDKIRWGMLAVFTGTQATVFQFWTPTFLREYGCGTPNGSLWTIVIFVQFYILIWLFRKVINKLSFSFWIGTEAFFVLVGMATVLINNSLPEIMVNLYYETIIPYLWIFWAGMLVSNYWNYVGEFLKKWWFLFVVGYIGCCIGGDVVIVGKYPLMSTLITSLGCIGIAFKFPRINIKTDISYEMYILHMIIANVLITLGMTGLTGMMLAIIITVALSVIIFHMNMRWVHKTK